MTETLYFGPRDKLHSVHGRLFQAKMWRNYARAWDCRDPFVVHILRVPRSECVRRARVNLYLAHRLNRASGEAKP
jgi:hypothetical protein